MAARQKGSFSLGGTLEILADAPADARLCVKTKSELTDANSYPYKYVGMIVSVADEGKAYILTAADTTIASNWKELGEGGGGGGGTAGSVYTGTLLASGWNASNQQTLTFTDYSADYHGVIGLPADATAAQMEEYRNCLIRTVSQSGATVTFECEEIPTINLPVEIYCGGGSGSGGGAEAFIITVTMNGGGNLVADKTPKELEDALASNAIAKVKLPMYGLVLDLSVASGGNFAFSTFYTEDATDPSTTAFGTILMVKDTDSTWDSITMQTFQGDAFQKEVKCGADLFDQPAIYLNDFDHTEDTTNEQDIVSPHRLTSAEMTDIMSTLPGAPTQQPVYSTTEQVVGTWIDGKPIYQKTISLGGLTTKDVDTNINDIDVVVNISIMASQSGREFWTQMPRIQSNGNCMNTFDVIKSSNKWIIKIAGTTDWSSIYVESYATIQYTKTTDTV